MYYTDCLHGASNSLSWHLVFSAAGKIAVGLASWILDRVEIPREIPKTGKPTQKT